MAFGTVRVSAKIDRERGRGPAAATFREAVLRTWLPGFFTPRELRGTAGDNPVRRDLLAPDASRWLGEEVVAESPLSRLTPDFSLFDLPDDGHGLDVTYAGGLFHSPPVPALQRDWYGRVVYPNGSLSDIAVSRVTWTGELCVVSVGFPFAGYPLTSHLPGVDADFGYLGPAPADLVHVNREHLRAVFRELPHTLRVPSDAVTWEVDWQEAGYPGDRDALREFETALSR